MHSDNDGGIEEQEEVVEVEEEEELEFDEATIVQLAQPRTRFRIENDNVDDLFAALGSVEVLGLESSTHGRDCPQHICCGHYVRETDKLVCKWEWQLIDETPGGAPEEVVQVYRLTDDGVFGCHVGYIPRFYFFMYGFRRFDLLFLKVKEDYCFSNNSAERRRSYKYHGMALCSVIKNNPRYNGRNPFDGEPCDVSDSEYTSTTYVRGVAGHAIKPIKKKPTAKKKIVRKSVKTVEENTAPPTVPFPDTATIKKKRSTVPDTTTTENNNAAPTTTKKKKRVYKKKQK